MARRSASTAYALSIFPGPEQFVCSSYGRALGQALAVAAHEALDVWLTEDWTHFVCLTCHRPGRL